MELLYWGRGEQKIVNEQAGAELGQAQQKLGLYFTLIFCRLGFSRFGWIDLVLCSSWVTVHHFQSHLKEVQWGFKKISRVFQGSFENDSSDIQWCFKKVSGVSRYIKECLKKCLRGFNPLCPSILYSSAINWFFGFFYDR